MSDDDLHDGDVGPATSELLDAASVTARARGRGASRATEEGKKVCVRAHGDPF